MPAISKAVTETIERLESLSERKVVVQETPDLPTFASVKTARGSAPFHLVQYQPIGNCTNYLIVYQLGFLIRLFSCPPEQRWEVAGSSEIETEIQATMLDGDVPAFMRPQLVGSMITQMRTFAVGFRVDEWISAKFPELKNEQRASVTSQLAQNEQALSPDIRARFPKRAVDANSSMNAAYASYWSDKLDEKRYMLPFEALGYSKPARELLSCLEQTPDTPENDRLLIEQWGKTLGMENLFEFQLHTFS